MNCLGQITTQIVWVLPGTSAVVTFCAGFCTVKIHPGTHVLDRADHVAPTRKHELAHTDHTDHADHTDEECIYPEGSRSSGDR